MTTTKQIFIFSFNSPIIVPHVQWDDNNTVNG